MCKHINNRKKLIDVALKAFARKGYASVGVQEIVNKAKVTKPTLYHYFGNKKGLLTAVLEREFEIFLNAIRPQAQAPEDLVKALEVLTQKWFDFAQRHPDFFYLYLSMSFLPSMHDSRELFQPHQEEVHALMRGLFEAAAQQHKNLAGHEPLITITLNGLLNHYAMGLLNGSVKDHGDLVHKVVKQFMYGIYVL